MSAPRFLADENLNRQIVLRVLRVEPSVQFETVQGLKLDGLDDASLLEFAARENWILISHDVNTLRPLAEQRVEDGRGINGVLLASVQRPAREVAETLVEIWSLTAAEEWRDRVVFVPF